MARKRIKQPTDASFYHAAFQWMGIGFEFCLVIGFFVFCGYWLDKLEPKTAPGWMILGFFVGFGVMFYIIVKRAKRTQEELDDLERQEIEEEEKQEEESN